MAGSRLSRLAAVEEQLRALLPLPPQRREIHTDDELRTGAVAYRERIMRGDMNDATINEWTEVIEILELIDSMVPPNFLEA